MLILDEPTSALDHETETEVLDKILNHFKGIIILIAHKMIHLRFNLETRTLKQINFMDDKYQFKLKQIMHLYIISKADEKIGLGHLIRCFNIAKFFEKRFCRHNFYFKQRCKKICWFLKKTFNFKKKTIFRFSKTNAIDSIDKTVRPIVSKNTINYLLIDIENFPKRMSQI